MAPPSITVNLMEAYQCHPYIATKLRQYSAAAKISVINLHASVESRTQRCPSTQWRSCCWKDRLTIYGMHLLQAAIQTC